MSQPLCPTCSGPTEPRRAENKFAPFCSRRCKLIDLGNWLDESYSLDASISERRLHAEETRERR